MINNPIVEDFRKLIPDLPELPTQEPPNTSGNLVHAWIVEWRRGIRSYFEEQLLALHGFIAPWIDKHRELSRTRDIEAEAMDHAQKVLFRNDQNPPQGRKNDGGNQVEKIVHHHKNLISLSQELAICTSEIFLDDLAERIRVQAHRLFRGASEDYHAMDHVTSIEQLQEFKEQFSVEAHPLSWKAMQDLQKSRGDDQKPCLRSKKPREIRRIFAPSEKWRSTLTPRFPMTAFINMKPLKPSRPQSVEIFLGEHTMHSPIIYGKKRAPVVPSLEDMQLRADRGKDDTTAYVENGIDPDLWLSTFADAETTAMNLDQLLRSHKLQGYEYTATLEALLQRIDKANGNGDAKRGVYLGILKQLLNARLASVVHGTKDPFEEMEHRPLCGKNREWHFEVEIPNRMMAMAAIPNLQGRWQSILGTHTGLENFIQRVSRLGGYMRSPEQASRLLPELLELNASKGEEIWGGLRRLMRKVSMEQNAVVHTNAAELMLRIAADKKLTIAECAHWEAAARAAMKSAQSIVSALKKDKLSPQT